MGAVGFVALMISVTATTWLPVRALPGSAHGCLRVSWESHCAAEPTLPCWAHSVGGRQASRGGAVAQLGTQDPHGCPTAEGTPSVSGSLAMTT